MTSSWWAYSEDTMYNSQMFCNKKAVDSVMLLLLKLLSHSISEGTILKTFLGPAFKPHISTKFPRSMNSLGRPDEQIAA